MIKSHEPHTMADRLIAEASERLADRVLGVGRQPAANGWSRTQRDTGLVVRPDRTPARDQGWEVHPSTSPADGDPAPENGWVHGVRHQIPVEPGCGCATFWAVGSGRAARGGTGGLPGVFPTVVQLPETLEEPGETPAGPPLTRWSREAATTTRGSGRS